SPMRQNMKIRRAMPMVAVVRKAQARL
ncbi:hypothetical protein OA2633_00065 [Oceanicaulis alexandrii HTCC2633]|nr:hypothetical protein OA2633_00065 [Oceanicaulis alexandrii HTCC2633] [Oceanicaulis sp. HTCC2633]